MTLPRNDQIRASPGPTTINRPTSRPVSIQFYIGLIGIVKNGQTYPGIHEPLVSTALFKIVQDVLAGKRVDRSEHHVFGYSRIVRCRTCGYSLIGELRKGHVYYRCHNRPFKNPAVCPPISIREERLDEVVIATLSEVDLADDEVPLIREIIAERQREFEKSRSDLVKGVRLQLDAVQSRLGKIDRSPSRWND